MHISGKNPIYTCTGSHRNCRKSDPSNDKSLYTAENSLAKSSVLIRLLIRLIVQAYICTVYLISVLLTDWLTDQRIQIAQFKFAACFEFNDYTVDIVYWSSNCYRITISIH